MKRQSSSLGFEAIFWNKLIPSGNFYLVKLLFKKKADRAGAWFWALIVSHVRHPKFKVLLFSATSNATSARIQAPASSAFFFKTTISPNKNWLTVIIFSKKLIQTLRKNFAVSLFPFLVFLWISFDGFSMRNFW